MENESNTPETSGDWLSETKNWVQDNIRIVLSIVIVLAIALGVYSYSKRGAEVAQDQIAQENTEETDLQKLIEEQGGELVEEEGEVTEPSEGVEPGKEEAEPAEAAEEQPQVAAEEEPKVEAEEKAEPQPETVVSQAEGSYEVTAANGDSLTTLARSAVKQYLDANNDPTLTAEHKVYIEDYLAKKMGYSHYLRVGETKSFSEQDISAAVSAAKNLTPSQLDHLKIYSQRVSNT